MDRYTKGKRELVQVGTHVAVYWRSNELYYEGIVRKVRPHKKKCFLVDYYNINHDDNDDHDDDEIRRRHQGQGQGQEWLSLRKGSLLYYFQQP